MAGDYRMYLPVIPVLIFAACIPFAVLPAVAGSVNQENIDRTETSTAPSQAQKPPKGDGGAPIETYLFMGQDDLRFDTTLPVDSGLLPASGEDDQAPQKAGQIPGIPPYE